MRGGEPGAARVEDRGDGTYAVTYTLPAEGAYQIAVTGPDARHVRGSPVAVTVFRCAQGARAATSAERWARLHLETLPPRPLSLSVQNAPDPPVARAASP